jgi:hypothetical protein
MSEHLEKVIEQIGRARNMVAQADLSISVAMKSVYDADLVADDNGTLPQLRVDLERLEASCINALKKYQSLIGTEHQEFEAETGIRESAD